MRFDSAKLTLVGHRQENQDKVEVISQRNCVLIVVVDGMGGHSGGAKASEITINTLGQYFRNVAHPVIDPQGFLTLALAQAHDKVVDLGQDIALENRPRATCAVCLIQDGFAYWAHVGDSRVYQLRSGAVHARSRDHSHVELLLREGLVKEHETRDHPMRNYVECCLGGDRPLPDMSIAARKKLVADDVLLVCTDGLWSGVDDAEIARLSSESPSLEPALQELANNAVQRNAPHSDNTSVAALRWIGH
ncbi:MAG: protein phosphatase 2C domain-containing protein [Betaproteobacteria bacterium]|nr:protein phosphatase 2C domain-containing protein [Betaproteobacteria bacterium]